MTKKHKAHKSYFQTFFPNLNIPRLYLYLMLLPINEVYCGAYMDDSNRIENEILKFKAFWIGVGSILRHLVKKVFWSCYCEHSFSLIK